LRRASLPTLPQHVIGLVESVANVKRKIVDNHILAVVGMGGIGKTTLVKRLYHEIHADFKKSSFLENVKKSDIVEVQKKLIMDLCDFKLLDCTTYLTYFKQCWKEMKILVIIDDVEESQIIELLGKDIGGIKRSENGSRIIMTGRNWQDFENVIPEDGKFGMEELNHTQAMEVFSWKAFEQSIPPHDFASITNEVVHACQGLPLSLEVTGSWLRTKKNVEEWKESLLRLKNAQPFGGGCIDNDKLWGRLRICYDDLAHEEREMFLDIACFFSEYNSKFDGIRTKQNGITSQKALQIWKVPSQHSPRICLRNLMDRSLVKVNDEGNLVMHDQLRDMGRQIVREASNYECRKQSRIWDKEETKMVLFNEKVFISSSNVHQSLSCLPW
jgi:energy-coupling factor transporter ATP-binding protein EcfA2